MSDMFKRMKNWKEESGIPHKDGKIKWFVMSFDEDGGHYVGEYDMTDWDKTFEEQVFPEAQSIASDFLDTDEWQLIRGDHLTDLMFNVANCLDSAGEFKKWWLPMDFYDEFHEGEKDGV